MVSLKRRLFYYVPAEEEGVPRYRDGRRFKPIKGIRKLHSVLTSQQLKVLVRQRSCYCGKCLYENYSSCRNKDLVDDFENASERHTLQSHARKMINPLQPSHYIYMLRILSIRAASLPLWHKMMTHTTIM